MSPVERLDASKITRDNHRSFERLGEQRLGDICNRLFFGTNSKTPPIDTESCLACKIWIEYLQMLDNTSDCKSWHEFLTVRQNEGGPVLSVKRLKSDSGIHAYSVEMGFVADPSVGDGMCLTVSVLEDGSVDRIEIDSLWIS